MGVYEEETQVYSVETMHHTKVAAQAVSLLPEYTETQL